MNNGKRTEEEDVEFQDEIEGRDESFDELTRSIKKSVFKPQLTESGDLKDEANPYDYEDDSEEEEDEF